MPDDDVEALDTSEIIGEISSANLEGFWMFDENTGTASADASGNGRNATLFDATWSTDRPWVSRRSNNSVMSVTTVRSEAALVGSNAALTFNGNRTVTAWINRSATGTATIVGMRQLACGGGIGWIFGINSANRLYLRAGSTTRSTTGTIPVNQWVHVAVTNDGSRLRLYMNGVEMNNRVAVSNATAYPLSFGHVGMCTSGAIKIDEVRIYSRALSAGEIALIGTRPPAPTGALVTNQCAQRQTISWNAVPNVKYYYLYRGTAAGNETYYTSVAPTQTSFTANNLTPNTQVSWSVLSDVEDVYSLPSTSATATTLPLPDAPVVSASAVSNSRINLTWATVPRATRYFVYMNSGSGFVYRTTVLSGTSVQIAGLTPNTNYQFIMRSLDCSNTHSVDSAPASATTLP